MLQEGVLGHSVGMFKQTSHSGNLASHLIHSGAEHCTLYLNHVRIAGDNRVDGDRVLILHLERVDIKLAHIEYRVLASSFPYHLH